MASPKMASMSKTLRPSPSSDYLLCIQMTNSTPLSPQAQAVLHEFWQAPVSPSRNVQLAAALRAAALYCKRDSAILLSLADELEGADA